MPFSVAAEWRPSTITAVGCQFDISRDGASASASAIDRQEMGSADGQSDRDRANRARGLVESRCDRRPRRPSSVPLPQRHHPLSAMTAPVRVLCLCECALAVS